MYVSLSLLKELDVDLLQYQPGGSGNVGIGNFDPLADTDACARDIFLMQQLGVNTYLHAKMQI